jgi:hypothetical protein
MITEESWDWVETVLQVSRRETVPSNGRDDIGAQISHFAPGGGGGERRAKAAGRGNGAVRGKTKVPTAAKTKGKYMEPWEIKLTDKERDDLWRTSKDTANGVVSRARINRLNFNVMLVVASADFKDYADPRISQLENQIKASEVFRPMLEMVLGVVGGEIGKKIGQGLTGIAKELANAVYKEGYKVLQQEFVSSIIDENEDISALKKGVKALVSAAQASATHMSDTVIEMIEKPLLEVASKAASKKPWSEAQGNLLKVFLDRDLETTLESFGVPTGATASSLQGRFYQRFVYDFEKKLIVAQLHNEGRSYNPSDNGDRYKLDEAANHMASKAVRERQQKIDAATPSR